MKTLKEQIEVMQAFDRGEEIEACGFGSADWYSASGPCWDWVTRDYRVVDKFRELKEAHARGEKIEFKDLFGHWMETPEPHWMHGIEYRVFEKHREIKEAFARGEDIQFFHHGIADAWVDASDPGFYDFIEYRVKPKEKQYPVSPDGLAVLVKDAVDGGRVSHVEITHDYDGMSVTFRISPEVS